MQCESGNSKAVIGNGDYLQRSPSSWARESSLGNEIINEPPSASLLPILDSQRRPLAGNVTETIRFGNPRTWIH
jgi:hypothetical protein